jgi:hypothetical protein
MKLLRIGENGRQNWDGRRFAEDEIIIALGITITVEKGDLGIYSIGHGE